MILFVLLDLKLVFFFWVSEFIFCFLWLCESDLLEWMFFFEFFVEDICLVGICEYCVKECGERYVCFGGEVFFSLRLFGILYFLFWVGMLYFVGNVVKMLLLGKEFFVECVEIGVFFLFIEGFLICLFFFVEKCKVFVGE